MGKRKLNIYHAQIQMGCSPLNSNLHNNHVLDAPCCTCGSQCENAKHNFLHCPLYIWARAVLRTKISAHGDFNLETILYGIQDAPEEFSEVFLGTNLCK